MGNKLGQLEDGETGEGSLACNHKDYVLRLWVDLFNVREESSEEADLQWYKITDDVVPANVSCSYEDPQTIYHITAYNRQVEKICDVRIIQPGTKLRQPSESFIHWKDPITSKHWGFNFTSGDDAAKFRDTCLTLDTHYMSKSSSFGTVRLGGVKKWRAGTHQSSSKTRKSKSSDVLSSMVQRQPSSRDQVSGMVTMPRFRQQQQRVDSRALFAQQIEENAQTKSASHPKEQRDEADGTLPNQRDNLQPQTRFIRQKKSKASSLDSQSSSHHSGSRHSGSHHSGSHRSDSSSTGKQLQYERPSTLSAAHLKDILFSRENLLIEDEGDDTIIDQSDSTLIDEVPMTSDPPTEPVTSTPAKCPSSLSVGVSSGETEWPAPPTPVDMTSSSDHTPDIDSAALQQMLQNWPMAANSNSSFGVEADEGDPSITAPLPQQSGDDNSSTSGSLMRTSSHCSGIFRGSQQRISRQRSLSGKSSDSHNANGPTSRSLVEAELHLRSKCAEQLYSDEENHNTTIYPDSGFGGTVSTEPSGSVRSGSRDSQRSSASLGNDQTPMAEFRADSICSSASSSQLTQSELTHVRPFTIQSEVSDDDSDSGQSITTLPPDDTYLTLAKHGATRKTGWLEVKNWLIHTKKRVALANKRSWKRYWVTLRGTTLMFYACDDQASLTEDAVPRHIIHIDGGVAQSIPEHPKREHIFSVSSTFGDAYLFQAPTQIEHDNWVTSIHSACASQFARENGKANSLKTLQTQIQKLQENIDSDSKMKKMAELQLTVVKDTKSRSAITRQIHTWEETLESLYMDQYRYKCYLASLQASELPNPKTLLTNMSRFTKSTLGKLGVLNVTSFHSLIRARTPNAFNTYMGRNKKKGLLATLTMRQDSHSRLRVTSDTFLPPTTVSDEGEDNSGNCSSEDGTSCSNAKSPGSATPQRSKFGDNLTRIQLPNNQSIVVEVDTEMTVVDILEVACSKRQFIPSDCFLRIKCTESSEYSIPDSYALINDLDYERIEICNKVIFQIQLTRNEDDEFGVELEQELADNSEREDEVKVFICETTEDGPAARAGLQASDELLTLNGQVVSEVDIEYIEEVLSRQTTICMTIRSCRLKRPSTTVPNVLMAHADSYIDNMMCPPPPSQERISDRVIDDLIVPAPSWVQKMGEAEEESTLTPRTQQEKSVHDIRGLLSSAEHVTHLCRMAHEKFDDEEPPLVPPPVQPLTDAQKLRKIILELINTERNYVKDLGMLMERYLEPLKEETFLSSEEVVRLVGNIQEIVHFQREFLKNLEESIDDQNFLIYTSTLEFKNVLFSIAGSFLYYANHFKLYSSFCASHSRAQKVLHPGDNSPLKEFLHARNPKQQHSATLESYLIKPIQRILKYPLLLQQLRGLTEQDSDEFTHLSEALNSMESVAEHINEMQKIYEEYGTVFDEVMKNYPIKDIHGDKKKLELNVGDLEYYGETEWLNACDDIAKSRKGWEHVSTIFVFKHGVVLLCQEKIKSKPKKYKGGTARGSVIDTGPETCYCKFLPVVDIQVRTLPTAHARGPVALWELLHLKSAADGRPEKIYHMASSTVEMRGDFLKYIRHIIRDSVKKMPVPKTKSRDERPHSSLCTTESTMSSEPRLRQGEGSRFSMNLEQLNIPERDLHGQLKSRTFADLADLTGGGLNGASSRNSISSDMSQGSGAKLVYSSQDPLTYSSKSSLENDAMSPVWQKRSDSSSEDLESAYIFPGTVHSYSKSSLTFDSTLLSSATEC